MTTYLRECSVVFRRQIRMNLRNPAWVLIGIMQPVLYLLLFGPLLKPLVGAVRHRHHQRLHVPGARAAGAAGHVRRVLRRLLADRRVARGRDRGRAGDPGRALGAAGRPAVARRPAAARPGADPGRPRLRDRHARLGRRRRPRRRDHPARRRRLRRGVQRAGDVDQGRERHGAGRQRRDDADPAAQRDPAADDPRRRLAAAHLRLHAVPLHRRRRPRRLHRRPRQQRRHVGHRLGGRASSPSRCGGAPRSSARRTPDGCGPIQRNCARLVLLHA